MVTVELGGQSHIKLLFFWCHFFACKHFDPFV